MQKKTFKENNKFTFKIININILYYKKILYMFSFIVKHIYLKNILMLINIFNFFKSYYSNNRTVGCILLRKIKFTYNF